MNRAQTFSFVVVLVALLFDPIQSEEYGDKDWYETTSIYQIYTRSFKDSDGDGIGDLKGIQEKLDYIKDIGFETIWIQSFFKSTMIDFGYDVTDFKVVDPIFGTMEDLRRLVDAIHEKGMRVMFDFIPNHTSDENEWFKKSVNKEDPYTDFYIWQDPKGYDVENWPLPPNNWLSFFDGSAWRWHEKRNQFYYAVFSKAQPDLNYRNPEVRNAMKDVLRFWMDFGADGFRIDAPLCIFEDRQLRDNPWVSPELENSTQFGSQKPIYQFIFEDTFKLTHEWRSFFDEYKKKDNATRILAPESWVGPQILIRYFGNSTHKNAHFPFYFGLVGVNYLSNATSVERIIHDFTDIMPPDGVPSWVIDTHDIPRSVGRDDPEFSEAASMIQLLLPGVASVYYGQEISMKDGRIRPDQQKDSVSPISKLPSRDGCRTPMQWDDSMNAGFTTNKSAWLPVDSDYWKNNVKIHLEDPRSHLNTVKRLIKLRNSPVFKFGKLETCVVSEWVYMFARKLDGQPSFFIVVNLGSETEPIYLNYCAHHDNLPNSLRVHTASANSGYNVGDGIIVSEADTDCSTLRPKAGIVLTTAFMPSATFRTIPSDRLLIFSLTILFLGIKVRDS